ncbi:MAG: toprim domain-containing protein [Polyangiaceae bacterium]
MHDAELHRFKSEIHLVQFAMERYGYERDRRESSRASHVLRHPGTNDKIIVRRAPDGHWTYFSVRDDRDRGTIVDFLEHRGRHASLGHLRQELRHWLGTPRPDFDGGAPTAVAPARDPQAVARAFAAARGADNSPYLNARGIRPETLRHPRFAETWGVDARGNALFVHTTDAGEVTGFEIKNRGFTGFSPGGSKSTWQSVALPSDRTIVVTESAIDALSYFQLHPAAQVTARFLSTAGAPSAHQIERLGRVFAQLPAASRVVAAVDSDEAGEKLATRIEALVCARSELTFDRHSPSPAKDWNDVLQQREREFIQSLPARDRSRAPDRGR